MDRIGIILNLGAELAGFSETGQRLVEISLVVEFTGLVVIRPALGQTV